MERIALKCIARLNKQFAAHELINEIKAAGYGFVGNAEVRSRRFCIVLSRQKVPPVLCNLEYCEFR